MHGWQSSLENAQLVFAQFLALASCPSYLKPFIFNWPCGGFLTYQKARDDGARGDQTCERFVEFIRSLAQAGVVKLHLLLHSMGSRVFSRALPAIAPLLRKRAARGSAAAGRVAPTPVSPAPEEADVSGTLPEASGTLPEVAEEPQLIELSTCTFLHPDHEVTSRGQTCEVAGVVVSV